MTTQSLRRPTMATRFKTTFLTLGALLALEASGLGQAVDWPSSSAAALRPPARARWSIAYQLPEQPAAPVEKAEADAVETVLPVKAEYQLDQSRGRAVITYKGGREKVIYLVDGLSLSREASGDRIRTAVFGPYTEADGWFGKFYPGFSWVDKKYFDGIEAIDGVDCYHFKYTADPKRGKAGDELAFDPANPKLACEAWVEVKTKRPYLFRQGELVGRYQFEPEGGNPVALPPEFQKAMRVYYGYAD